MKAIVFFIAVLFFSFSARAVVVNFAGVPNLGATATSYSENGVNAHTSGGSLAHAVFGKVHLTDYGTPFASSISFSMTNNFDAIKFDIRGSNNYCSDLNCQEVEAFNNVRIQGKLNGNTVATDVFYSGTEEHTYFLGAGFRNLDTLIISVLLPPDLDNSSCASFGPCSFFDIDNLELRAVDVAQTPLPGGLPLYGAGMVIIGYAIRRRRKKLQN